MSPTASLEAALADAPMVIAAVPSHGMRHVLQRAAPLLREDAVLVSATKGLETDSLDAHVAGDGGGDRAPAIRSPCCRVPSFALEVARGLPTAVVVASADADGGDARAGQPQGARAAALRAATT